MSKSEIKDKTLQDEINNSLDFDVTIPWPKELTEVQRVFYKIIIIVK